LADSYTIFIGQFEGQNHLEDLVVDGTVKVKDKGKVYPRTGHEVPEGE
jgi:hypothetical protein